MLISSVWRDRAQLFFSVGLLVGGGLMGLAVAVLGAASLHWWAPEWLSVLVLSAVALVVLSHELQLIRLPLPQNARQVPERIVDSGPRWGAFQFGIEMGTGTRTFMTSAQPHLLFLGVLLVASASPLVAVAAGVGFGLGRTLVPFGRTFTGLHDEWSHRFESRYWYLRLVTFAGLSLPLVVAVWLRLSSA